MEQRWTVRESRSPVWVQAILRRSDQPDLTTVIANVSNGGCRVRLNEALTTGEFVEVVVPRLGTLLATVRWSDARTSGLQFVFGSESCLTAGSSLGQSAASASSAAEL